MAEVEIGSLVINTLYFFCYLHCQTIDPPAPKKKRNKQTFLLIDYHSQLAILCLTMLGYLYLVVHLNVFIWKPAHHSNNIKLSLLRQINNINEVTLF